MFGRFGKRGQHAVSSVTRMLVLWYGLSVGEGGNP